MTTYLTPGVYVREVPSGARPIQRVGTSTAGFVGVAPDSNARVNEIVAVEGWPRFVDTFADVDDPQPTALALAVQGFFDNGGRRLHIVNLGSEDAEITGPRQGLSLFEAVDELAIVAAPGRTDIESYQALITHCEKMEDRFAILDAPADVDRVERLTEVATAEPTTSRRSERGDEDEDTTSEGGGGGGGLSGAGGYRPPNSTHAAVYFPQVVVGNPFGPGQVTAPASGSLAGIYARTDATRGVHKAPANEPVRGALNLTYRVTREEQGVLNPRGVNCLRYFPAEGIMVWGARTLADAASEYLYVPVRRLVNMLKESIAEGTRWVVFEPNDYQLWNRIRRDVRAFLTRVWRDGALMGRTPDEAFFVRCDEQTNPPESVDAGEVRCVIGIAPVKPAEFVIFEITHTERGVEAGEGES
ncbi:MAG: phage tail sheath subtilisin-like domain-containing protein [Actinobacteria bacterium]|nr:phage tail sheath subtilisin-like domain-containing protein [Actinomycetota bacterium]